MPLKFEQNCMVQTTQNFELFTKKTGFQKQSVDDILKYRFCSWNNRPFQMHGMELRNIILITTALFTLSYTTYGKLRNGYDVMQLHARIWKGLLFNAKLLIWRLPSFSVPKIMAVRHMLPG